MADSSVREWMEAENNQDRDAIAIDIAGSMDLGVMDVPTLLKDLQPYLNGDSSMIDAGNGKFSIPTSRYMLMAFRYESPLNGSYPFTSGSWTIEL
jgi:hypothetical protein